MREILLYLSLPVLALWILRSPFVGLALYTGANIVRPEMLFWGGAQGAVVFKTFIGATIFSVLINRGKRLSNVFMCKEFRLILSIGLALLVSLVFSPYPTHPRAYELLAEFFKLGVLSWLLLELVDDESLILRYQNIVLGCFVALGAWGIDQRFRGNDRLEGLGGTAFGDSNTVAAAFVLVLPLGLNAALHAPSRRGRTLGWIASAVLVLAIVSTQSRGGFVGICVAAAAYLYYCDNRKKLIVALAVIIAISMPFVSQKYFERMSTIRNEEAERDPSAGSRLVLWKAGMKIFMEYPIAGAGFLSFPKAKEKYKYEVEVDDEQLRDYSFSGYKVSHNTYIQTLAEGGLITFIPFMWLITGSLLSNYRIRKSHAASGQVPLGNLLASIDAGLVGCCVCIIFIDWLTSIFIPIQILVAYCIKRHIIQSANVAAPTQVGT